MGGYGGVSFKTEKNLKRLKIYEWEDMWECFCGLVRWVGTVGWYVGWYELHKVSNGTNFIESSNKMNVKKDE